MINKIKLIDKKPIKTRLVQICVCFRTGSGVAGITNVINKIKTKLIRNNGTKIYKRLKVER